MARTLGMGSQLSAPPAPQPEIPPGKDVQDLAYLELRKIRERVAPPKYEVIQTINGAAQTTGSFDTGGNEVNAIIVDVTAGTLSLWLTSDAGSTNIPPYTFTNVGQPFQMLLTLKNRQFSWVASAACTATLTIQAL
jgi:hypothetical protein